MPWLRRLAWRLGLHPVPPGRGLLVVANQADDGLDATLRRVREAYPRINLFQLASPPGVSLAGTLRVPPPAPWSWALRRYLRRLKIQAIVAPPGAAAPPGLLQAARSQGIEVVSTDDAPQAVCARLAALMATPRAPAKSAPGLEATLLACVERPPLSWLTSRKFTAIESLDALGAELKSPATILCLGNGPSSRDPALADVHYDALFRVNHLWLETPAHARPDVIFTGKKDTLSACRFPAIFAFQTRQAAARIMLRSIHLARRIRYCTAEQLGCIDFAAFAPYKPTNGAVMIAVAAALRPRRLIVAGMDLFSDPRGAYAGATDTPNAYAVAHDREVEANAILEILAAFSGEVVIIGDVLKARWESFRHRPVPPAATQS